MKFSCPSCNAKYNIADEKLKGRSVKVRCKKCELVFKVDKEEPEGPAAEMTAPAAVERPTWFVIVDKKQVGPLTKAQVLGLIRAGKAERSTFCWKPGQSEWLPMQNIAELKTSFQRPSAPPPPPPVPGRQPAARHGGRPATSRAPADVPVDGATVVTTSPFAQQAAPEQPRASVLSAETQQPGKPRPAALNLDALRASTLSQPAQRRSTSVEPLKPKHPAVAPLEGQPAAVAPLERKPAAVAPLGHKPAAVAPLEGKPAAVAPLERKPAAVEPLFGEPSPGGPRASSGSAMADAPTSKLDLAALDSLTAPLTSDRSTQGTADRLLDELEIDEAPFQARRDDDPFGLRSEFESPFGDSVGEHASASASEPAVSSVSVKLDSGASAASSVARSRSQSTAADDDFFPQGDDDAFAVQSGDDAVVTPYFGNDGSEGRSGTQSVKDLITEFSVMVRLNRQSNRFKMIAIAGTLVLVGIGVAMIYLIDSGPKEGTTRVDSYYSEKLEYGMYRTKPEKQPDVTNPEKGPVFSKVKIDIERQNRHLRRNRPGHTPRTEKHSNGNQKDLERKGAPKKLNLVDTSIPGIQETLVRFNRPNIGKIDEKPKVDPNPPGYKDNVKRIVAKYQRSLVSKCARSGSLLGVPRIFVSFRITPDGGVSGVSVRGKMLLDRHSRCMERRVAEWKFPASKVGMSKSFSLVP